MMNCTGKFNAASFNRIRLGLQLNVCLMFLCPAVISFLLSAIVHEVAASGINPSSVTAETLLQNPTTAVRALYSILALQYCAAALCALITVSGISELEDESDDLLRSRRVFVALMFAEAIAMFTHITDVLVPENLHFPLITAAFPTATVLVLLLRCIALRKLLLGYRDILRRVGDTSLSRSAEFLSKMITVFICLVLFLLFAVVVPASLYSGSVLLRRITTGILLLAIACYAVIQIRIARFSDRTARFMETISG